MYLDKKNKNPKEYNELLSILEKDYGQQAYKDQRTVFMWENEDKTKIMLSMRLEKKRNEISISVMRDIFDISNMEVYK